MRNQYRKPLFLFLTFFMMMIIFSASSVYVSGLDLVKSNGIDLDLASMDFKNLVSQVDIDAVLKRVEDLSSLGSRMSGYSGCEEAGEYIYDQFTEIGLSDVSKQYFDLINLIDHGANLTMISPVNETIKLFPLYPNGIAPVVTPSSGISGELIYVGGALPSDIKGKKIEGNIVLMDFNSGQRWKNMGYFGAKAVVFIEPLDTLRTEADFKRLSTLPYSFPRFYIKSEDAFHLINLLESNRLEVEVYSDTRWEEVNSFNVLGFVKGSQFPDKYILVTAYYDSFSIVPSISPGASESSSVSTLIELARFFKNNQPKTTVLFVAFGGHWQGLVGSRAFIEEYTFQPGSQNIWGKVITQFNLQLSPDSSLVAPGEFSHFFSDWAITFKRNDKIVPVLRSIASEIEKQLGGFESAYVAKEITTLLSQIEGGLSHRYHPFYCSWHDHEPLHFGTVLPAFSFSTLLSFYRYLRTPLDTLDKININNLVKQLNHIYCYLSVLVNSSPDQLVVSEAIPEKASRIGGWGKPWGGFFSFSGQVVEWNFSAGFYSPVPDAFVAIIFSQSPPWDFTLYKTDKEGKFTIWGYTYYGKEEPTRMPHPILAFKLNESGSIMYAPDLGRYTTARQLTITIGEAGPFGYSPINGSKISTMRCGSIVLFDVLDPYYLSRTSAGISVNDFNTHSPAISFSIMQEFAEPGYPMTAIFVSPDKTHEIIIRDPRSLVHPMAILLNATEENKDGVGYRVRAGQQITLPITSFGYGQDLLYLNLDRVSKLQRTGVLYNLTLLDEATSYREKAKESLGNYDYESSRGYSLLSWASQRNVNVELRDLTTSIINSVPFFGMLLIPFAFFAERLIFKTQGSKRLVTMLLLYALTISVFSFLHPGFPLAFNIWILVLGLALITLVTPVAFLIFQNFQDFLKELRIRFLGKHEMVRGTTSSMFTGFTLGTENMRRRAFRSGLTLTSIVAIVFSLVLFTSLSSLPLYRLNPAPGEPQYSGIEIRDENYFQLMSGVGNVVSDLEFGYRDSVVVSRAWVYPVSGRGRFDRILVSGRNQSFVRAMLGLTPEEIEVTKIDKALLGGGRWLLNSDVWSCILSKRLADTLEVEVPDTINVSGVSFTVIGIVDDELFTSLRDLDQRPITPIDPTVPGFALHLPVSEILIIPYDTSYKFLDPTASNVFTVSASVKFRDHQNLLREAVSIFNRYKLLTYVGTPKGIGYYGAGSTQSLFGWEYQMVSVAIAGLTVTMQMLGAMHERRREIFTMGTLGLAPKQMIMFFLMEGGVYSILGSVFGYVLAIGIGRLSGASFFNFGSNWVVMVVFMSMLLVILSSAYPAFRASIMVAPSLQRRWEYATMPVGREWEFSIPFTVDSDVAAMGAISFLGEFLEAHASPASEIFSTRSTKCKKGEIEDRKLYSISTIVNLTPYDINLSQNVDLSFIQEKEHYIFDLHFTLLSGSEKEWITHNRKFVNAIREQLLLWRALKAVDQERYINAGKESFGEKKP